MAKKKISENKPVNNEEGNKILKRRKQIRRNKVEVMEHAQSRRNIDFHSIAKIKEQLRQK
jgi:DNA-directed RNA polymerase subunit F